MWGNVGYVLFSRQGVDQTVLVVTTMSFKFMRVLRDSYHLLLGDLGLWLAVQAMGRNRHRSKTK